MSNCLPPMFVNMPGLRNGAARLLNHTRRLLIDLPGKCAMRLRGLISRHH
jgi:hypothetical protein